MTEHRNTGFTLIELIAVVVILSIIGALGFGFVASTLESYNTTINRGKLAAKGRAALERMARQIRAAVPNSVRVNGQCVEFLPVAGGGNYIGELPDINNGASASATIATATHSVDFGTARYVVVGGLLETDIYGSTPGSLATLSTRSANSLTLSAVKVWERNSIRSRFFLADDPQAFCINGANLEFYESYLEPSSSNGNPIGEASATVSLLSENVAEDTPFTLSPGSEDRNAVLTINISFTEGADTIALSHEVFIRNVP